MSAVPRSTDESAGVEAHLPLRPVELHVLLSIAERARHGYAIIQATEERTQGRLQLEAGTLYRALRRMLASGLVQESAAPDDEDREDERRRYYGLTDLGRRVARAEAERLAELVAAARASRLLGGRGA